MAGISDKERKLKERNEAGKHLGSHVWLIIQGRYEKGDSVRGMAKEYGISASTICNKAKKCGWLDHGQLKEEAISATREKIKDEFSSSYKEMAKQAVGNHFKLFRYIQKLGLQFVQDVERNASLPAAEKKNINREIYQLNVLAQTIKSAIDGERLALGMDGMKWDDDKDAFSKFTDAIVEMRQKKAIPEKIDGAGLPESEDFGVGSKELEGVDEDETEGAEE